MLVEVFTLEVQRQLYGVRSFKCGILIIEIGDAFLESMVQ